MDLNTQKEEFSYAYLQKHGWHQQNLVEDKASIWNQEKWGTWPINDKLNL